MTATATEFVTQSSAETIEVGRKLSAMLVPPIFLILHGDLGAGKTTLVKGIAEAFDAAAADEVTSPTFTLVHEYEGTREDHGKRVPVRLYHLDLYRIDSERQLETLGLDDLLAQDSIVLVEWGEKFPSVVKRSQGEIVMTRLDGDKRRIVLRMKPEAAAVSSKNP